MIRAMRATIFLFSAFIMLFSGAANAQTLAAELLNDKESITLSPEFPAPGEVVKASMNNYSSFLSGASIAWSINGAAVPETDNHREISFIAGDVGEKMDLRVTLTPEAGAPRYIERSITPIYVDIVFEPQTHVPFFYKGRGLPSIDSIVNATALIDNGSLQTGDYVYIWRVNNVVLEQGPIRGRNKVSFETPRGTKSTVYLQVTRPNGDVIARKAVYLPAVYPSIYFYEESGLYGPSTQAIVGNKILTGNVLSLIAEPYNLDSRVYNAPDIVEWSINGQKSEFSNSNPYSMVVQRAGASGVSATVGFQMGSLGQVLQSGKNSVKITY